MIEQTIQRSRDPPNPPTSSSLVLALPLASKDVMYSAKDGFPKHNTTASVCTTRLMMTSSYVQLWAGAIFLLFFLLAAPREYWGGSTLGGIEGKDYHMHARTNSLSGTEAPLLLLVSLEVFR